MPCPLQPVTDQLLQWQPAQLVAEQVLQPLEPATALEVPLELFEKAANFETARFAPFLQVGHGASAFASLIRRSNSNLSPHFGHSYS